MTLSANDSGYGSGYGSFEEGVVFERAGAVARRRHGGKDVPFDSGLSHASTLTTPTSSFQSLSERHANHSTNPSTSSRRDDSAASMPEGNSENASPEFFNSPPFPGNAIPVPYLPLRQDSLSRLQLGTSPASNGERGSDRQSSPTPSLRMPRPRKTSPPRLPKDRQPSPLPPASSRAESPETPPRFRTRARGLTSGSRDLPSLPSIPQLSPSKSIPELAAVRRQLASSQYRPDRGPSSRYANSSVRRDIQATWDEVPASYRSALTNGSHVQESEIRSSVRSALTNASAMTFTSSSVPDASETERSSVVTRASSVSDSYMRKGQAATSDEGMTVEDAINLYLHGFNDDSEPGESFSDSMDDSRRFTPSPLMEEPESPIQSDETFNEPIQPYERFYEREVHKSPSLPELSLSPSSEPTGPRSVSPPSPTPATKELAMEEATPPSLPPSTQTSYSPPRPIEVEQFVPAPRDRYGFKKASQHITVEQYDAWNKGYTEYLERRSKKWHTLMKHHGLLTENPNRFPPKSDKVKRYIRKGIPPDWRGAAWFWYAGGPAKLVQEPNLYWNLVEQANKGMLSNSDREQLERDLNRTFPDNIRFKPDPPHSHHPQWNETANHHQHRQAATDPATTEPSIVRALRRVLQAFALHNPTIGYCQSLNFIAGLLLLFLDEDEEKAFILLDIITSQHLPGTHAKVLEANVDIAVLMTSIREALPAVWGKIDDGAGAGLSVNRLPTVSLTMTPWFMSLFVGTLPIETVLRVWDSLFYEGSKTLFRIALAIFKLGEAEIRAVGEQLEVLQMVQAIPRKMLDVNALMEACFKRRGGCGFLSQELIDQRRAERRRALQRQRERPEEFMTLGNVEGGREGWGVGGVGAGLRRAASRARLRSVRRPRTPRV